MNICEFKDKINNAIIETQKEMQFDVVKYNCENLQVFKIVNNKSSN